MTEIAHKLPQQSRRVWPYTMGFFPEATSCFFETPQKSHFTLICTTSQCVKTYIFQSFDKCYIQQLN